MKHTMLNVGGFYEGNCLGICANQIGSLNRIVLISRYPKRENMKHKFIDVLINPDITDISEETTTFWEGCLSDDK